MLLACNRSTPRMTDYLVHGIDSSHYQSTIDWEKVAQQDISFAFIKATEGAFYTDSLFCNNWNDAQAAGILRGAYHFFRPTIDAHLQAHNFMTSVQFEFGDLPPVLDVEVTDGVNKDQLIEGIKTWVQQIEYHSKMTPIIYTNQNFFNDYLADDFSKHPIWIARYSRFFNPWLDNNREWRFWQYGNKGRIEGIRGEVDLNVFKGDIYQLEEMCFGRRMAFQPR